MSKRRGFLECTAGSLESDRFRPGHSRMPQFLGGPRNPVQVLSQHRVALIGVGSLGGRIAEDFSRSGVHAIWIVDPKAYKPESVLTHGIHPAEVGQGKAEAVARRCKQINPAMRVFFSQAPVQELPLDAFADVDLVLLAADNLACEMDLGERCHRLQRPLLQAAVHGESLTVILRSFTNRDSQSACPRCLFGTAEVAALEAELQFSCEPSSSARPAPSAGPPTMSISALCTLAAGMAGSQAVRWALRLGTAPADAVLEYNVYTHRTVVTPVVRHAECPCEHEIWEVRNTPRRLGDCTVQELLQYAGPPTPELATVLIDGFEWIETSACRCSATAGQFVARTSQQPVHCPRCGAALLVTPFGRAPAVSQLRLGRLAELTLDQLGASGAGALLLRTDRPRLFRNSNQEWTA